MRDAMEAAHIVGQCGKRLSLPMTASADNLTQTVDAIHRLLSAETNPGTPRLQSLREGVPMLLKIIALMQSDTVPSNTRGPDG